MLIKQKPNIKSFHEDNGQDLLLSGEVDVVMEYNGDIAQIMAEDDRHQLHRAEGRRHEAVRHAGASRKARRIRRTLSNSSTSFSMPEVGAEISKTIQYPSPNAAAVALMPASYKDNPVIFPPADSWPSASTRITSAPISPACSTRR